MLSRETLQLMSQVHEEWMKEPTAQSRPLETMKCAYQQICAGEDPWTGLGNFSHAWYGYAKGRRADLVTEPLVKPEEDTEQTRRWGAFCAASVEFLCDHYDIACPGWVHEPCYILETPWWYTRQADDPGMREHLLRTTPSPFARRNIFCSNRLFQNKYEMSEWVQEARNKGMTNAGDIWEYARQQEIRIHGG